MNRNFTFLSSSWSKRWDYLRTKDFHFEVINSSWLGPKLSPLKFREIIVSSCNWFPFVTIAKYHKLSGLKQHTCTLQFCGSEAWCGSHWIKIEMLAGLCSFWKPQGRIGFVAFSSLWRLPALFGLWPLPFSKPERAHWILLALHHSGTDSPASLFCI